MQSHIRKFAWFGLASLLVLSLTVGAVLAHEGRPVGDYRFIVGWLEEPAYEGARNAVSVRVNKVITVDAHDQSDGHHQETPTPQSAEAGHDRPEEEHEPEEHQHGAQTVEAQSEMSFNIRVEPDTIKGANLFLANIKGFAFTPENVDGDHVAGEGHAHVYVNGVKVGRLYGDAMKLEQMAEGENAVRVALNSNDHAEYTWNGKTVEATAVIVIAEGMGGEGYGDHTSDGDGDSHDHDGDAHEGQSSVLPAQGDAKPVASMTGQHDGEAVPVDGLEGSIQVEVIHAASGAKKTLELTAVYGEPGHYVAPLIPTASGVYEFRVFGNIEGTAIDETFASEGGGGGFDDIQSSAGLQFPEELPELREIESGVRGALNTAQQAQDAALAAQQQGGGNTLAIVALIVGVAGVVLGIGGVFVALRRRGP